jgi:hypothetical protein
MKQTTLIFTSLSELWNFKQAARITTVEINTDKRSLSCELEPKEIELAVRNFRAVLSENKINTTSK